MKLKYLPNYQRITTIPDNKDYTDQYNINKLSGVANHPFKQSGRLQRQHMRGNKFLQTAKRENNTHNYIKAVCLLAQFGGMSGQLPADTALFTTWSILKRYTQKKLHYGIGKL